MITLALAYLAELVAAVFSVDLILNAHIVPAAE